MNWTESGQYGSEERAKSCVAEEGERHRDQNRQGWFPPRERLRGRRWRWSFCHSEDVRRKVNRLKLFVIEVPPGQSGGWNGEFARSLKNIGDDVPPFTSQLATLSLIKDLMLGVDAEPVDRIRWKRREDHSWQIRRAEKPGGRIRYLPPFPLSTPAGPTSSSAVLPRVVDAACDRGALFRGRNLQHHRPDILRIEEGEDVNRIRIWSQRLVFPAERSRPIDDLVEVRFGILHRLKHQLCVDRRHSPDNRLDRAAVQRALGQLCRCEGTGFVLLGLGCSE